VRLHSSDSPIYGASTRIGYVRSVVSATLCRVTVDNATVSAHTPVAKVRGQRVQLRFDPEKRYWVIR
jgi:hypothetical protein